MIAYQDRTFCEGAGCAKFGGCDRALTDRHRNAAKMQGLLIARFTDPKKLPCYEEPKPQDSKDD